MPLPFETARWADVEPTWPTTGRHVLASATDETVVVYQAYRPEIGRPAAERGGFASPFSFERMSWVKPNFLWMMYRSGWGSKDGQTITLALVVRRETFERWMASAVPSSRGAVAGRYPDDASWKAAVKRSDVRLQWDPDHGPRGNPLPRRAVQLGLRRAALRGFDGTELAAVHDISEFVAEQRARIEAGSLEQLEVPAERVYPVPAAGRAALGMDPP